MGAYLGPKVYKVKERTFGYAIAHRATNGHIFALLFGNRSRVGCIERQKQHPMRRRYAVGKQVIW